MAFLNTASLLNTGAAEAVKTQSSNQNSQEFQANQSDEFAQALRKQMQQANKSAANIPNMADAKNPQTAKTVQTSHQPASAAKADKDQAKTTAKADEKNAQDTKPADKKTEGRDKADDAAATEAQQHRKKRLIAELETTDTNTAALTPWMQTMLAMRTTGNWPNDKGVAEEALTTKDILETSELLINPGDTASEAPPVVANPGAQTRPVIEDNAGIDLKQALTEEELATAQAPADFNETLNIAKSVAESVRATVAPDKAGQLANTEFLAETSTVTPTVMPAAQALPNSPWLNAAGVAQNANVYMSQVAAPFGSDRWQTAMNQHVLNMVGTGDDVASLTLSPPDLGPIQVVLKVDNQSVNTSFITDNPLVRQALEDGMQDLRERMQSQGLQLGQTFVGNGQQAQQHFEQEPGNSNRQAAEGHADAETAAVAQTAVRSTVSRGLVDTFV